MHGVQVEVTMARSFSIPALWVVLALTACASPHRPGGVTGLVHSGGATATETACRYATARRAAFETALPLSESMKELTASRAALMASGNPDESVLELWLGSDQRTDGECALAALEVGGGATLRVMSRCVDTYAERDVFGRYLTCLAVGSGSTLVGTPAADALLRVLAEEADPVPVSACSGFLLRIPRVAAATLLARLAASKNRGMQVTAIDIAARRCDGTLEAVRQVLEAASAKEPLELMSEFTRSIEFPNVCGGLKSGGERR